MSNIEQRGNDGGSDTDVVGRAYRDARDAESMLPSAALDDAIRAAAHRAVHSGPKLAGSNWIRRWTPQLAVAAVVLLSVSVLFVSIDERPDLAPAPIQNIALKQNSDAPAAVARQSAKETTGAGAPPTDTVDEIARNAPARTVAGARDMQTAREEDKASVNEARKIASTPASPSIMPVPAPQLAAAGSKPDMPPVQSPAAQSLPPARSASSASVAESVAPAPFPASVPGNLAAAQKKEKGEARAVAAAESARVEEKIAVAGASRAKDAAEPAAKPAAPTAASPPSPATSTMPVAPIGFAASPLVKQIAPATPAATISTAGTAAGATNAPARAPLADKARANEPAAGIASGTEDDRPGPWLKRLLALREQGKLQQLRDELPRFRKAHPNVVLPKSLVDLPPE